MTARSALALALLAALGLMLTGCGDPYKIAPVSGKVMLDGRPLGNVNVVFQPTGKSGPTPGPGSMGATNAQGEFTLTTVTTPPKPGAVVGSHTVRFDPVAAPPAPGKEVPTRTALPPSVTGATLPFDVPAGGTNKADFDLKSTGPPPGSGAPAAPPSRT